MTQNCKNDAKSFIMIIKSYLFDITQLNDEKFNKLLNEVKEYRKDKIAKLSLKESKYLSLAVELLIKKACEDFGIDYFNEEIVLNEHGKPSFKNFSYHFNTAHSGKYAFCVISEVKCGCDIENIKEYKERVAERFFTPKEREYLELSNEKEDLFYRLWTLKESYLKCIGKGLSVPLNSFELIAKDNNIIIKDNLNYQFYEFKHDNYRLAICLNINEKEKEKYQHNTSLIQL